MSKKSKKVDSGGPVSFQPGDLVFAKVTGYPPWPGIIDKVDEAKSLEVNQYRVFFFGTHDHAVIPVQNIWPYEKNKEIFDKPSSTLEGDTRRHFDCSLEEIQTRQMLVNIGKMVANKKVFVF